ncbi:MAG: type II secretion system inner membrane protein GspF [Pseudomonadales bacterium]|nr:type II secretion system inner membrane protein GspF [Pseudomonadales bacterium]
MAAYEYIALDLKGRQKKGMLESDSGRQVRQLLRDMGLAPLSVKPAADDQKDRDQMNLFRPRGMNPLELALFTRQMSTLLAAGLPLEEALGAVAQQTEKRHISNLIMAVRTRVLEGHTLAQSMAEYPHTFGDMFRSTIAAGEQSGYLDKVFDNLADYTEQRFESRRNVEMAMLYPVILLVLAIAIVGFLLVYIVPDIVGVFENSGQELPGLTKGLISLSEFVQSYIWAMIILFAIAIFAARYFLSLENIRLSWDKRKLELPFIGKIVRGSNTARYSSTLSILVASSVPLVEAMQIAAEVVTNTWLKDRLGVATQHVSEGSSLRASLGTAGYFPPMMLHMVASGESSGELDTMLSKVSSYQQKELERLVGTLVKLFEPFMLLFMGATVMVIVLAVLLPILNMNELLG